MAVLFPPDFRKVHDKYRPFVRYSVRRLGVAEEHVDDVCQDVFFAAFRQLPKFRHGSTVKTWLFGFVYNVVRTHRRTLRRKNVHYKTDSEILDPDILADASPGPFEQVSRREKVDQALAAVRSLRTPKQEAFLLVDIAGLTAPEAAGERSISVHTLNGRLRSARQLLAQAGRRAVPREV